MQGNRKLTVLFSVLILAAILLVVFACVPFAQVANAPTQPTQAGAAATPTSTRSAEPTVAPNPLNVQVKVDEKLASSAVISTTGGTLRVQNADGTKFTLTFPKGALFSDEKITLTPIAAVDGLPFSGGLVGGVQIAPEGLRLFQPATLTIESPKTVAAQGFETVAFGYHEDGQGVYLNPSTVEGNILTLEVWHFSGAAAAQATTAEIQTHQQQNVPSNAEDAFTQRMQEVIGRERQAQIMGGEEDPNFGNVIMEALREGYDSFIAPLLPIALEDCAKAPAIISKALGWARQATLLFGDTDENPFQAEIDKIIETYEQVKEKCNQNYTGEGKYRISGEQSGMQVVDGYEFQITFRANTDGAIAGEGVLQKVEASRAGQGAQWGPVQVQCTDPGASALVYPPMRVMGTVNFDDAGQPTTFNITIVSEPSTNTSESVCVAPVGSGGSDVTWPMGAYSDQGLFITDIEIAATDGAQASGTKDLGGYMGTTGSETWELVIHKQANP